jgi:hypothetical protein
MTRIHGHTIDASTSFPFRTRAAIGMLVLLASASASAQMPGRCEVPVSERKGDIGCYVLESRDLGPLAHSALKPQRALLSPARAITVVREGLPMVLSSVGTEMRNSFALILHDSAQPWTMVMQGDGWKPAGRCPK